MSIEFCIRLKLSVRVACMIRFKVQFWFRKRLLNEELTVMRCQIFWIEIPPFRPNQIIESKCKATFRDAYWNLACFLLLAIMGIFVFVDPKLNLCLFCFSYFQSKYRYLWCRELSASYNRTPKRPDQLHCAETDIKDFFCCPISFMDASKYLQVDT